MCQWKNQNVQTDGGNRMMDEKEPRFTLDVPVSLPENITDCKLVSELELWLIPYHLMELELVGKFRTWVIPNDDELYPNGRDKLVVLPLVSERTVDYEKRIDIDDSGFVVRFQDLKTLLKENEQLKQELQGMEELLQSYRKTIKHDAELLADATRNGYLPPLNDSVSNDGWICGCCKHFHSGVRDRCDKDNNWVLKDGSCQDFER